MEVKSDGIYMNKKEILLFGAGQIALGSGMLLLSSKQVKKGSWGKTTGNIVNFIGFGEIGAGVINIGQAAMRHIGDRQTREYWENQGYKVYEE